MVTTWTGTANNEMISFNEGVRKHNSFNKIPSTLMVFDGGNSDDDI